MTAKEMVRRARANIPTRYIFEGDALIQLINQLCKEQRELCGLAIQEKNYYSNINGEIYKEITNAKQPEI